jgi:TrmH family RNA methyltransferase
MIPATMRRPLLLTSLDNPRIKQVIHLRKHRDRRKSGLFVAEGLREVQRAAEAGLEVREVFLCPPVVDVDFAQFLRQTPSLARSDPHLFEITPPLLTKMAYIENPEGVMAVVRTPEWGWGDLPSPSASDLFLVAAGINKPGNLGAMARTASAGGATALLADAEVDAFNPNAIRASTCAVYTLPTLSAPTPELVRTLRDRPVRIVIATPEAPYSYTDADLTGPLAIVIGAEDQGVPAEWREAATDQVSIPMASGIVDSLNASNTAAILLFEALRQRRGKMGTGN